MTGPSIARPQQAISPSGARAVVIITNGPSSYTTTIAGLANLRLKTNWGGPVNIVVRRLCMTKLCASCGAKILDSTFQRTSGLCKPCWKDHRWKKIGETPFGVAYDTYFHQLRRLTEKYFDCYRTRAHNSWPPLCRAERRECQFSFQEVGNLLTAARISMI